MCGCLRQSSTTPGISDVIFHVLLDLSMALLFIWFFSWRLFPYQDHSCSKTNFLFVFLSPISRFWRSSFFLFALTPDSPIHSTQPWPSLSLLPTRRDGPGPALPRDRQHRLPRLSVREKEDEGGGNPGLNGRAVERERRRKKRLGSSFYCVENNTLSFFAVCSWLAEGRPISGYPTESLRLSGIKSDVRSRHTETG